MIRVFFNEDGYYMAGESVEVSKRCSPALTERGDPIFQILHHTYKILHQALLEIKELKIREDVVVYSDSRIIDEINGYCPPLDETCDRWVKSIRRHSIPAIRSVVFFRKKPTGQIKETIAQGHSKMLPEIDKIKLAAIAAKPKASKKTEDIKRFRKSWFGESHE